MAKARTYPLVVKQIFPEIFKNPTGWLSISAFFLLLSLPLVTWGIAYTFALVLADRQMSGRKRDGWKQCRLFLRTSGKVLPAFLMGLIDTCLLAAIIFAVKQVIAEDSSVLARFLGCLFFWIDLVFLCSGTYRYPLLAYGKERKTTDIFARGVLMTISDAGNVFLILMVALLFLLVGGLTGIFLFAFTPGAISLLVCINFREKQHALAREEDSRS